MSLLSAGSISLDSTVPLTRLSESPNIVLINSVSRIRDILVRTGTDPDPRSRTSDLRLRILPFSTVNFKTPTKNNFFVVVLQYW